MFIEIFECDLRYDIEKAIEEKDPVFVNFNNVLRLRTLSFYGKIVTELTISLHFIIYTTLSVKDIMKKIEEATRNKSKDYRIGMTG